MEYHKYEPNDMVFSSPSGNKMGVVDMVRKIVAFIDEDPSSFYRLVIGSDSQARSNGVQDVDFITAVVVHRIGKGAKYFYRRIRKKGKGMVLRNRIHTETLLSLELAGIIVPDIRKKVSPAKYDLEIHIDVGSLGPTREMIREVVGMVAGNGYTARTKPDSWGASSVADRHT